GRYDYLAAGTGTGSAVLCGRDAVQVRPPRGTRVDLPALAGRLSASGEVAANDHLVRFRVPGTEMVVFGDGRAIVKGVKDAAEALLLRGPRREPARAASRFHQPARQDRRRPPRRTARADAPLLLGRGAALRAAAGGPSERAVPDGARASGRRPGRRRRRGARD